MEIRLYKNFNKRSDSTKRPTGSYDTFDVRLKEETSIQSPTFLLSEFNNDYSKYNYAYVPSWDRYYFRNDIRKNIDGVFEISLSTDPGATYRQQIAGLTTYIERCSDGRYIDPFIRDGAISALDRIVSTESEETDAFPGTTVYILRVMGRGDTNGIGTFVLSTRELNGLFSAIWADIDGDSVTDYLKSLCQLYINDPSQYIVGVYRSPIGITKYMQNGEEVTLFVGGHETDIDDALRLHTANTLIFSGRVLNKPVNMYNDWRATDPAFSQYTLYIPTIGVVNLPAEIMHMELKVTCAADLYSGDLTFVLYADGDIIATYNSNCYASVSVGVQNGSSGSALATSAIGAGMALAGGNVLLAAPTIIAGTQKIISPPSSVLGTQGSIGALASYPNFVITCMQKSSSDYPVGVYGRPCCKNLRIGNMLGYVKCQNASINIAGSMADKQAVNQLLNGGFYFE